jgi:hypothetical protein
MQRPPMLFETRDYPVATRTNNADAELSPKNASVMPVIMYVKCMCDPFNLVTFMMKPRLTPHPRSQEPPMCFPFDI